MTVLHAIHPLYALIGLLVGALVGLTGVGGGSIMTPLLILLFGIPPVIAVGTDLVYASVTMTGGTIVHGFNRTIEWRAVGRLALGSVPATALTLLLLWELDIRGDATQSLVTAVLSIALFITALSLIFRGTLMRLYSRRSGDIDPRMVRNMTIAAGAIAGTLVSLSSVGAGAIGVTALILLYPNMPAARIVGSNIAHAVPLTLLAGAGHYLLGSVDWTLLEMLLVGSIPGIVAGSIFSARVPEAAVRGILATTLMLLCLKIWFF